ncbi:hypothetical protein NKH19_32815 [Mesorhizobium sp. M1338]|uniref:hypothetical protein n=1 Tax=unclassified Mesorhizobium TaxID=325217 RepID=UPI0033361ADB
MAGAAQPNSSHPGAGHLVFAEREKRSPDLVAVEVRKDEGTCIQPGGRGAVVVETAAAESLARHRAGCDAGCCRRERLFGFGVISSTRTLSPISFAIARALALSLVVSTVR